MKWNSYLKLKPVLQHKTVTQMITSLTGTQETSSILVPKVDILNTAELCINLYISDYSPSRGQVLMCAWCRFDKQLGLA